MQSMTATTDIIAKDQAHRRLLDSVISFTGADQNGSRAEVRAAAAELEAAKRASQSLLYPEPGIDRLIKQIEARIAKESRFYDTLTQMMRDRGQDPKRDFEDFLEWAENQPNE
jgi:hypothetical protein